MLGPGNDVPLPARNRLAEQVALLFTVWALSRILLVCLSRARGWYAYQDDPFDLALFPSWGHAFATGEGDVPLRDTPWEYPVGAVLVVVLPALLTGVSYQLGFVGLMLATDAVLLLALLLIGLRTGRLGGAWLWCAAVPLLGPVAVARYDVIPTLAAVAGLGLAPVMPFASGVVLALGGSLKLWPLLLLPLTALLLPGARRAAVGAAVALLVVVGVATSFGGAGQLLSFLTYQRDRGLEIESLPALPLLLAHLHGNDSVQVFFGFGSYQIDGPYADLLRQISSVGLVVVLAGVTLLVVRARRAKPDLDTVVVLAAVLVAGLLCVNKVLSAQYPLWLAGLIALGLCTRQRTLLPAVPLLCALLVLTQLVYPLLILDITAVQARGVVVLALRDAVLLALTAQLAVLGWRATRAPTTSLTEPVTAAQETMTHAS
ncbi:MAG: DUF2029 domain-containing protein [Frankiaceae bacterium]|nr:DUF2029 domain-containing protein [Frankiaceae bacterium]